MQKQSFARGAVVLMAANAVSKILGAAFKIPLTYILHEDGMAVYNTAFTIYVMFLAFVMSGIPTAVSKKVAQADERSAYLVTDTASKVLFVLGTAASLLLFFGAPFFAGAMREEKAVWAIRMAAPSVFLVAVGTGYKSFFHGASSMNIPAVSQVTEAAVKLIAGYALAVMMLNAGKAAAAAGAISGVAVGELIATGILAGGYAVSRFKYRVRASHAEKRETMRELLSVAVPLLLAETAMNAVSVTDTSVLRTRILASGLSVDEGRFLYGAFSGYAMTIFNLPVGILGTIGVSLLPAAASAAASGNFAKTWEPVNKGIEMTLFIGLPSAVMMWLIPEDLLNMLFRSTSAAHMLKYMAPCVVTVSFVLMFSAVIQACGNVSLPPLIETGGFIVKIIIMWFLCSMPDINIYGAVIGSNVAYLLIMIVEIVVLRHMTGFKILNGGIILRPAAAAAAMAAAVIWAMPYNTGTVLSVLALCGVGGGVYLGVYGLFIGNKRLFTRSGVK